MSEIKLDSWIYNVNPDFSSSALLVEEEELIKLIPAYPNESIVPQRKTVGELITAFVHVRDTLSDERKAFTEREKELKDEMSMIEASILEIQRSMGVTSLSTKDLTAYQVDKTSIRMGDWDTFSKWVLKTGNIQCVEKRCAKLACLEVEAELKRTAEEKGLKPVGLDSIGVEKTTEICVQIRRK